MSEPGFFDTHQRLVAARADARAPRVAAAAAGEPLTPSALNRLVEQTLKARLPPTIVVRGEVSNFNRNRTSGHLYFTLKDAGGCVDAVMWSSRAERSRFEPRDGMELLATGAVGVYVPRGRYQLVVNALDPVGEGALEVAKRQLEARLRGLGLFDDERKRAIPRFARTVAIVTSRQAAGFADMLKVFTRTPWLRLLVYAVPVQGPAAASAIAAALRHLSERHADVGGVDVVLLGRGGGSLEDLWAFNEESIVRAIAASRVPVVTGIGHDVDVSLADLAADHHAHTPTEAAATIVRHWTQARDVVSAIDARLGREARRRAAAARMRIALVERHEPFRRPGAIFDAAHQRLDDFDASLARALRERRARSAAALERAANDLARYPPTRLLRRSRERIDALAEALRNAARQWLDARERGLAASDARLRALSPLNVLKRGYSMTTRRDGTLVRSVVDVRAGDRLVTRVADGTIGSTASDPRQPELF